MTEEKSKFVEVSGLWAGKGKVAFSGRCKDGITIPAGAKILVFSNNAATAENRRPMYRIVYTTDDDQSRVN